MRPTAFLHLPMIFIVFCCLPRYSASTSECKIPPFDIRRCYQMYTDLGLTYSEASQACQATGQRLASLENEKLLDFVLNYVSLQEVAWIGLSRSSYGQPYMWTNGQVLDTSQYTNRISFYWEGQMYSVTYLDGILLDLSGHYRRARICETFKSGTFQVRRVGDVLNDVSSGYQVTSNVAISLIDCARKCNGDVTWVAISHDRVTCKLHFQEVGQNITVTSMEVTYTRI